MELDINLRQPDGWGSVMIDRSVLIRVPATVGNFGGAASGAALALEASLNVRANTRRDGRVGIRYFGENGERVPRDSSNLAVRAMRSALESGGLPFLGVDMEMYGSAPVAVGLGSSTAAVWAGLLAADRLYRLGLDEKTLFELAGRLEPRKDNLRAAWAGGFVARVEEQGSHAYRSTPAPEGLVLKVVVPQIGTPPGRQLRERPEPTPSAQERTVPGLEEALGIKAPGLQAIFVCGSGPAVGVLGEETAAGCVAHLASECFAAHGVASSIAEYRPTNVGAQGLNDAGTEIRLSPAVGSDMSDTPMFI